MPERFCSPAQMDGIAAQLNAGNRDASNRLINECTINLVTNSDYFRSMSQDAERVLRGDPEATRTAEANFARVAEDERRLWQSMRDAANNRNPNGLCQLTIVENPAQGPSIVLTGPECR